MMLSLQSLLELVLAILIAVGIPSVAYIMHLRDNRRRAAGTPVIKVQTYKGTLLLLWVPMCLVALYWVLVEKDPALLGLRAETAFSSIWAWLFVMAVTAFLVMQLWTVKTKGDAASEMLKQTEAMPALTEIMPYTPAEYKWYMGLSVSAGITEELMFRGFLIWFFSAWLPLWAAALLALGSFVAAHIYQQSVRAIIQVTVTGAVLTLLYLLSGSLWPAIVLHIIVDVAAGATYMGAIKKIRGG